jgi:hypothetical protein
MQLMPVPAHLRLCMLCFVRVWLLAAGILAAFNSLAQAGTVVTVRLKSGRSFVGEIDPRTNRAQLWLRFGTPSATLFRPVSWDRLERAIHDGRALSPDELRALALAPPPISRDAVLPIASADEAAPVAQDAPDASESLPEPEGVLVLPEALPEVSNYVPVPPPKVRSIHIDAWVANWDADVEVDGVVVRLFPLSCDGALLPARGTLEVDLIARQFQRTRLREPFPVIGRWATAVNACDVGPAGALYRFEFQARNPEFDLGLAPHGVLHARFVAPGQGTFDASAAMLRVRPFSAVRDRLELETGQRFFPGEHTGSR